VAGYKRNECCKVRMREALAWFSLGLPVIALVTKGVEGARR
jgi:hypothetical protein